MSGGTRQTGDGALSLLTWDIHAFTLPAMRLMIATGRCLMHISEQNCTWNCWSLDFWQRSRKASVKCARPESASIQANSYVPKNRTGTAPGHGCAESSGMKGSSRASTCSSSPFGVSKHGSPAAQAPFLKPRPCRRGGGYMSVTSFEWAIKSPKNKQQAFIHPTRLARLCHWPCWSLTEGWHKSRSPKSLHKSSPNRQLVPDSPDAMLEPDQKVTGREVVRLSGI